MRIGFTGTQSVGKTTLVNALKELPEFQNYSIATERSKYLSDIGIPLNTESTINGQMIFMAERACELLQPNILTDRTIWDVCSFTMNSSTINDDNKHTLLKAASCLMPMYDVVFYINPKSIAIENNGIRETNPEFRNKIDKTIKNLLFIYPPNKLIEISGPTDKRIQIVLDYLKTL